MSKQADVDNILKVIQRKVLKETHLLVEIKEIQARYLTSSHFKDIYLYLSQNKLPTSKAAIRKVEIISRKIYFFILPVVQNHTRERISSSSSFWRHVLIRIITLYHSSLFAGPFWSICRILRCHKNMFNY